MFPLSREVFSDSKKEELKKIIVTESLRKKNF